MKESEWTKPQDGDQSTDQDRAVPKYKQSKESGLSAPRWSGGVAKIVLRYRDGSEVPPQFKRGSGDRFIAAYLQ